MASSKKKTGAAAAAAPKSGLAATLAMFDTTRPADMDPESSAFGGATSDGGVDSDGDSDEPDRSHYVDVGKSALRARSDLVLDDPKYAGRRVSRADLAAGDWSDEGSDSDEEEDLEGSGDEASGSDSDDDPMDEDRDSESDGDEEEGAEETGASGFNWGDDADELGGEEGYEQDSEVEAFGQSDDESDDDEEASSVGGAADDAELTKKVLAAAVEQPASDAEKGQHIKAQMGMCDALLDLRIRLQKALTSANTLPAPAEFPAFMDATQSAGQSAVTAARKALADLMMDLSALQRAMIDNHPALATVASEAVPMLGKRKRSDASPSSAADEVLEDTTSFLKRSRPWRMDAMEKWHEKVNAAAGVSLNTKKFKAINTLFAHQFTSVMNDRDRLINRTHLKRTPEPVLTLAAADDAEATAAAAAAAAATVSGREKPMLDVTDETTEVRGSARTVRNASLAFIFDDSDFYSAQLKDLIDRKLADQPGAVAAHHATLRASRVKRAVDTRASKGRQLRFHVHDKLANFMAPTAVAPQYRPLNVPGSAIVGARGGAVANSDEGGASGSAGVSAVMAWSDSMVDEFFSSLFGVQDERLRAEAAERKRKAAAELAAKQAEGGQKLRMFG
ncbi:rRNA-processing protein bfr2 [Blastocladiella emersonii ATCC 22665]|nr:rRNA-processing protein bfr2 [Blastocladiella emersonii ATCC 22665]